MAWKSRNAMLRTCLLIILVALAVLSGPLTTRYLANILSKRVSSLLEARGVYFHHSPRLLLSLSPPMVGLADLYFQVQNSNSEPPFLVDVRIDTLTYTLESTSMLKYTTATKLESTSNVKTNQTDFGSHYTRFARISWSEVSVNIKQLNPQPHLRIERGELSLLLSSNRISLFNVLLSPQRLSSEQSGLVLSFWISRLTISVYSVTSIPIAVSHPIIARLEAYFPSILNAFTNSPTAKPDGSRIISPPHLSMFAPSLVLPSLYRAILGLKSHAHTNHGTSPDEEINVYRIPLGSMSAMVTTGHQRRRHLHRMSVQLVDMPDKSDCSTIQLLNVNLTEVRGREEDGRGGCCSVQLHRVTSGLSSLEPRPEPSIHPHGGANAAEGPSHSYWSSVKAIAFHPQHLASFILRLLWTLRSGQHLDTCRMRNMLEYHIEELEVVDKTPYSDSLVTSALGFAHQRALNVFEDALSLVF